MAYLIHFTEQSTELAPFDVKSFTLNDGKFIRLAAPDAPPRQGQDTAFTPAPTDEPTPITLPGKEAENWGEVIDENILQLTEHFASFEVSSSPGDNTAVPQSVVNDYAIRGQAWYNLTDAHLYIWDGKDWNKQAASRDAIDFADNAGTADFLYNTAKDQMFTADSFVLKSGDTMNGFLTLNADPTSLFHAATKQYVDNQIATVANQELDDLVNVNVPAPSNGDVLSYDLGTNTWISVPATDVGSLPLEGLTFVPSTNFNTILSDNFTATGASPVEMLYTINLAMAGVVPPTATHVKLRTLINVNGDNNSITLSARQFTGSGTWWTKHYLDPSPQGIGAIHEGHDFNTWTHPFNDAANTIELRVRTSRGSTTFNDDIAVRVYLEGYYINDRGSPPERVAAHDNAIMNGNFQIWQRGSGPYAVSAANTFYTADRWRATSGEATTFNALVTREPHVAGEISEGTPSYYLKWAVSTASGATTMAGNVAQLIENSKTFAGRECTLSFYARSALSNSMQVNVQRVHGSGGSATEAIASQGFALTPTWQKFSMPVVFPGMTGVTSNDADSYILIDFNLGVNVTGEFRLSLVQLESGTVDSPFKYEPEADHLAKCQRYYTKSYDLDDPPGSIVRTIIIEETDVGVSLQIIQDNFPSEMRTVPTVTVYSESTGAPGFVTWTDTVTDLAVASVDATTKSIQRVRLTATAPGHLVPNRYAFGYEAEAEL